MLDAVAHTVASEQMHGAPEDKLRDAWVLAISSAMVSIKTTLDQTD